MKKSCEICAKRDTCKRATGAMFGFCNAEFEYSPEKAQAKIVDEVYDLTADRLLGLAVKVKEDPEWCREHLGEFAPMVKKALEKVLDIRQSERPEVWRYYFKTRTWPTIQNRHELRVAFEIVKIAEEASDISNVKIISIKRAIRDFCRRPPEPFAIWNGGDSVTTVEKLPIPDDWSREDATEWFKANRYCEAAPSPYDCTGQIFTTNFVIFQRRGSWWAYHATAMDV